ETGEVVSSPHLFGNFNWYDTPYINWDTPEKFYFNLNMAPGILISHSGKKIALSFGYAASSIKFGLDEKEKSPRITRLYDLFGERINAIFWQYYGGNLPSDLSAQGWKKGIIPREKVTLDGEDEKDEFKWSFCTSSFFYKIYSIDELPDDETLKTDIRVLNNGWKAVVGSQTPDEFRKKWDDAYKYISDVYGPEFRIWKMSLGPKWFTSTAFRDFMDKNKVSMGPDTPPVAGKEDQIGPFQAPDRMWDVVFICHGNQEVSRIALFAPEDCFEDTDDLVNGDVWIARHTITIADAQHNGRFENEQEKKRWYPNAITTFIEVKERDKSIFEDKILQPFFGMSFETLSKRRNLIITDYKGGTSMSHINLQREIQDLVEDKLQVILTGAPGTGKTYLAQEVAAKMILGVPITSADRIEETLEKAGKRAQYQFVQFHPGYDYSDFVEGIKPRVDKNTSAPEFSLEEGIFKKFCAAAAVAFDGAADKKTAPKFVMVIDEINRADLSRVFGELFFGLEKDYRGKEIRTQYDYLKRDPESDAFKKGFSRFVIPPNLYIIGTMNDIDRSVESMDFALRRRFGWREISWEESLAIIDAKIPTASNPELNSATRRIMAAVNNVIIKDKMELEPAFALGGAYFKDAADKSWDDLWRHSIRIILNEYLRGNRCEKSIEDIEKIWKEEVNKVVPGTYEGSGTTEHSDNAD
ncbi:MAG TPA: AAA family ATPase, partial [Syntrophales bacterium]|nr:AAA family ATPase [Syntrophales bacterium]